MGATVEKPQSKQVTLPEDVCDKLGIPKGVQYDVRVLSEGALLFLPPTGRAVAAAQALGEMLMAAGATREGLQADLRRIRESDTA